jgi:hypothetical protein
VPVRGLDNPLDLIEVFVANSGEAVPLATPKRKLVLPINFWTVIGQVILGGMCFVSLSGVDSLGRHGKSRRNAVDLIVLKWPLLVVRAQ